MIDGRKTQRYQGNGTVHPCQDQVAVRRRSSQLMDIINYVSFSLFIVKVSKETWTSTKAIDAP